MPILRSVCPLDCPDACSLHITVEDGVMTQLAGDPEHPVTQGFACVKTRHYPARQNHPERLRVPLKRVGRKGEGRFRRVSWDEALDDIAARTQEVVRAYGAESVLPYNYAGTMGLCERDQPLAFFRAIGASELEQTICATTGGAAWEMNYGPGKLAPELGDVEHARLILLWGINSLRSNSHLTPFLKRARARGARVIHIDPYRNETSRFADEHLQLTPGTDAALALALGGVILEEGLEDAAYLSAHAKGLGAYRAACAAWPPERAAAFCGLGPGGAARVRELARAFAAAGAAFIRVGYGMTRNEGGGNALRAVTLLPALTGAWRHRGGGAMLSTSGSFGLNTSRLGGQHLLRRGVRRVNMNRLASALELTENPIKALFVFNANPAAVAPDSSRVRAGLAREDLFTVVLEHFQTDTADYADYLLPATTFLEHPDLYTSYGHHYLGWAEPVVAPLGECKPNTWVFRELASRLGLADETLFWGAEEVARALLDSEHPHLRGITFERLQRERSVKLALPQPYRPYAAGSSFADRKIRFAPAPEQLEFEERLSERFPLRLISPPGSHLLNTTMGNIPALLKAAGGEPQVVINPRDAARLGVRHGERHRVVSAHGSILRKVVVSDDAKEGVLVALGQWWPKLAPDGRSLNDLTGERLTDLGGGSTFGNVPVQVEPVEAP
ncbi:molybdopterin-containing oxidoreductase family protein [Truepera radiovictrix]|uniref:Molybdopterin oxidoreductase n=1 Tax=Truepera radiovictrix (strain DSM 17093 / CIP 108686 / LMG 22925 / RQ-24) TaxID=649638 RepID=D7CT55_TRURR|nr:molybdopterin-dependent oxidoreductase [Truepera radiovictrix]ADI15518.1 molybdopterin oxidoreductase [Truepera radiovictrix DSM 17093]WMT55931.1 molybdopterin-dependent oxidoreductase [Truepera radiovictrix]